MTDKPGGAVRRLVSIYGAGPGHLVATVVCFALALYAGLRLLDGQPLRVAFWFLGSALAHDFLLFPLYAGVDALGVWALRRWPSVASVRSVPWLNHVRFPAVISGLLFITWSPLIAGIPQAFERITTFSTDPYLWRWVGVSLGLFMLSALFWAIRVVRSDGPT